MESIQFEFRTKPISVNQSQNVTIRKGKGVIIKSDEGKQYIKDIGHELMSQRKSLPFCFYAVTIWIPGKYRVDVGNIAKPLVDILVSHKRVCDDAFSMFESAKYYLGDNVQVVIKEVDFEESLVIRKYSAGTVKKYRKLRNG